MIVHEDRAPGALALAAEGRWPELLGRFRQARAAGAPSAGPLGHLLAYFAPPELAARLFDRDGAPGTAATVGDHDAGPFWEVLATRHTWLRLAPLLDPAPVRRLVAHTRVLLGEDLAHGVEPDPGGVPYALEPWEAACREGVGPVREYLPGGGARLALRALPADREGLGPVDLPRPGPLAPELAATRLLGAMAPWASAVCVRGAAQQAAAHLADTDRVTGGPLTFPAAYPALLQLASGGPGHGAAQGRLAVWRLLTAMTGETVLERAEVEALVARLRCFTWCESDDELCYLHLAVEDPATGLAWAVSGQAAV
ncbi:hypothetical protein [Kitasatospora terrestris]|uniref:Uncharacterized protein n=1 Tax=Kitasatospora terrestris TaxID=258051 RepID=A0ABP9E9R0_9ACTN